ncbi:MAG: hypothetical protein Q8O81_01845 [Giesbergeria sp.]|nr:hypothetical protein [Giesbergeria sp.]
MKDEINEQAERLTNKLKYWVDTFAVPMADIDSDAAKFRDYFENTEDQNLEEWTDFVESQVSARTPGSAELICTHLTLAAMCLRCIRENIWSAKSDFVFLISAAEQLSMLEGLVGSSVFEREARSLKLSEGGKKGAQVKHQGISKLKQWAVSEAQGARGADKEISRQLALRIPSDFDAVSKDPERVIYDAIRAARKSKS